ncbi:MAG: cytochrome c biogenesis heme-transporting ATPase CcmA [Pseudomonadales bacterium]
MLQVADLYCERQRRMLFEHLSFAVSPGELLLIKGRNGSGKTTLLKILTGLFEDYSGEVTWSLDSWPLFISHKPGVKGQLSARENLTWLARLHQSSVSANQIDDALYAVGLAGFEDVNCDSMSEGQRKRVNLARLFLIDSPAWILDEPLSAIDVDGVALLQERIERYLDGGGMVIMTSHQALELSRETRVINISEPQ